MIERQSIFAITSPIGGASIKDIVHEAQLLQKGNQYLSHREALKDFFGPETIQLLSRPGKDVEAMNPILPFLSGVFDKGIREDKKCMVPFNTRKVEIEAKGVPVLTRSSFITKVLDADRTHRPIEMGMLDLASFRDADFDVSDPNGVRPADVIINATAAAIREVIREVWRNNNIAGGDNYVDIGRYGGDELVLAFVGKKAITLKNRVEVKIVEKLRTINGYYKNPKNDIIEKKPIQLKKFGEGDYDILEKITFPSEEYRKIIFSEYMERGLLLTPEGFEREMRKYRVGKGGTQIDFVKYRNDYPEQNLAFQYPKSVDINDDASRRSHLIFEHPELSIYFNLARWFDEQTGDGSKRQDLILGIVENSLLDKTLGDMIYTKQHFIEHIKREHIDRTYIFDFKFLKEVNGAMSYADSDNNLKQLWSEIKLMIPPGELDRISVSRFGGALYVGVKKGLSLSPEVHKELIGKKNMRFQTEGGLSVPIGSTYYQFESNPEKVYENLIEAETASDRSFFIGLAQDMNAEEKANEGFVDAVMKLPIDDLLTREYQSLSKDELYALYLRGSRTDARMKKFLSALDTEESLRGTATYAAFAQLS